ncbi:MAG: HAD hydrolase-like protein, partial [Acholeplasmataceae bacterium]|nr:HAD hydrolase-like protein [Acholeplasmataceae bacterium]
MTRLTRMFMPDLSATSVWDIPYDELFKQGVRSLFFDLDNTLIAYDEPVLTIESLQLINDLQKRFLVVIISNSGQKRVEKALGNSKLIGIWHAKKPLKSGFKKAIMRSGADPETTMLIGDQLLTDVFGGHRMSIMTCLVKPIKIKSDRFVTRLNR